ncbi:histidine phosphatase family protein [Pseudomonas aeruginosa]
MKNVRLIRHGESVANSGQPTRITRAFFFTAKGLEQAHMVAKLFTSAPGLIVASPFLRAKASN